MDKQMIISIGRQCGSGGREIGRKLAEHYGLKFYDRNIIDMLAEDMEKDPENVARLEEKLSGLLPKRRGGFEAKLKDLMNRLNTADEMYLHERGLIEKLGAMEGEKQEQTASYLYRLALLSQRKLTAEELEQFLKDSYTMLGSIE